MKWMGKPKLTSKDSKKIRHIREGGYRYDKIASSNILDPIRRCVENDDLNLPGSYSSNLPFLNKV